MEVAILPIPQVTSLLGRLTLFRFQEDTDSVQCIKVVDGHAQNKRKLYELYCLLLFLNTSLKLAKMSLIIISRD